MRTRHGSVSEGAGGLKKIGEESRMYTVSSDGTIELDGKMLEHVRIKDSVSFIGYYQNAKLHATENLPPNAIGLD